MTPAELVPSVGRIGQGRLCGPLWPAGAELGDDGDRIVGGVSMARVAASFGTPVYVLDEADFRGRCRHYREVVPEMDISYAGKALLTRAVACWVRQEAPFARRVFRRGTGRRARRGVPGRAHHHARQRDNSRRPQGRPRLPGRPGGARFVRRDRAGRRAGACGATGPGPGHARCGRPYPPGRQHRCGRAEVRLLAVFGRCGRGGAPGVGASGAEAGRAALPHRLTDRAGRRLRGGGTADAPFAGPAPRRARRGTARSISAAGMPCPTWPGTGSSICTDSPTGCTRPSATSVIGTICPTHGWASSPGGHWSRAGVTLYRVVAVKNSGGRRFVAVDGGMSDNARPPLYGARYTARLIGRRTDPESRDVTVVGRHGEAG